MDKASTKNTSKSGYEVADSSQVITHRGIQEEVTMNRFHLERELDKIKDRIKSPNFSDTWPWFVTALAFLITLSTTSEYKNALGLSSSTWQAINIIAGILSIAYAIFLSCQAISSHKERNKKTEDIVDEICLEMDNMHSSGTNKKANSKKRMD